MRVPTEAERRQLADHTNAELAFDVDAVMRTVDDDPEYEWHPGGFAIRGREATRRMYAAFLPRWRDLADRSDLRFEVRSEFWNDAGRIREQVAIVGNDTGGTDRYDFVVVVLFGRKGVHGERTYASPTFHRLMLGDYFDELAAR